MPRDHMSRVARLLAVTIVMTFVHVGTGLSQTQPQIHTLGSPGPGGGAVAAWKKECETRADEKGLKGSKRNSVVAKCVKLGALPPELK